MDENTGLIEPFLKEYGFTFPVVPAQEYVRGLGLTSGLPNTWIVGANGVILQQRTGAGLNDHWIEDMLMRLRKAGGKQ